jgi:hypothetical protein
MDIDSGFRYTDADDEAIDMFHRARGSSSRCVIYKLSFKS